MDHTHIIHASDLERYADTRESQALIPELIYWLVKQSVPNLSLCRIPYGKSVNQPGWDGLVYAEEEFGEFVPEGASYWEIGAGAKPQEKATEEFRKRTHVLSDTDRAKASFVFVTPRSTGSGGWNEPEQTKWLARRKDKGWKLIRIIDGIKLADWLREFPVLGKWMAKKIGITRSLGGIDTPREHWDVVVQSGNADDPPLPPALFTAANPSACDALKALFNGKTQNQRLFLFAESEHDVEDFVAAYLASLGREEGSIYANRCLFIGDEDAWRSVVKVRSQHVLVASTRLGLDSGASMDLQTIATREGHAVIVPLCSAQPGDRPEIIKLRSPSRGQIETILKEAGYPSARARELAGIGGGRISALRRHLLGLGILPPYGTWDSARQLAQAGLVGKWDSASEADKAAIAKLVGQDYEGWTETLRADVLSPDAPLVQRDEKWRLVARGEAWNTLGSRITDRDLDRLQEMAVTVLRERDPQFDLPKEQRYAAVIYGKKLTHSTLLREGLAETLALVGSRSEALSSCSQGKAEDTASLAVRRLLRNASWDRWASLDSQLPLLAEAAPDEFLSAVESVLVDLDRAPFYIIFSQESRDRYYMSGLMWALETLAWSPDYLSRVATCLADIASIDPGGNWTNRPANSLADIFLPWHVQTTAPFEKRKVVIEAVLKEQPDIGWKLLIRLLPHNQDFTTGSHRPTWRDYIPRDWKDSVLKTEYWEQITAYTELLVGLAKESTAKLGELIEQLPALPRPARESLLNHLMSKEIVSLSEAEYFPLWESLDDLVRWHREFADARWALPEEVLSRIEEVANALAPEAPELKYQRLFGHRGHALFEERGNYEEQQRRLDEARQVAVQTILASGGFQAVLEFAHNVASPYEVGRGLGGIDFEELEAAVLPTLLDVTGDTEEQVVAGFVSMRHWRLKWAWVDDVLARDWTIAQKAKFLVLLPFSKEVWLRVANQLGEKDEELYWRNVGVKPYLADCDLAMAIEKLIEYHRASAAVLCVDYCVYREASGNGRFDEGLATRALLAVLEEPSDIEHLDREKAVRVLKRLQESSTADPDALSRIEWNFLPLLDNFSPGSPVTLEKRLASDPAFFAEVVSLVFRPKGDNQEDVEPDEQKQNLARNAYRLLTEWRRCPGTAADDSFNVEAFNAWLAEARRITEETGHREVAQSQIGHVLANAPADPNGLWVHEAVASALNGRDMEAMRSGFTIELFNQRGAHWFTAGKEELELAQCNRNKAETLEAKGFVRFAAAMRELASDYEREAEREANRDLYDD